MKNRFDCGQVAFTSFAIVAFVGASSVVMAGAVHLAIRLYGA